jgi:hypothetical protein
MATISTMFPSTADYTPFTDKEKACWNIPEQITQEFMCSLVGADFWGLYVRGKDGQVKEALYNTYVKGPDYDLSQQEYRDAITDNFDLATSRVASGETLVLMMWGRYGWLVEATRTDSGDLQFEVKRSPKCEIP